MLSKYLLNHERPHSRSRVDFSLPTVGQWGRELLEEGVTRGKLPNSKSWHGGLPIPSVRREALGKAERRPELFHLERSLYRGRTHEELSILPGAASVWTGRREAPVGSRNLCRACLYVHALLARHELFWGCLVRRLSFLLKR